MDEWARLDVGWHYVSLNPKLHQAQRQVPYLDKRTGMPSCVGAPAARRDGAFVRELTGEFSGVKGAVRTPSSGSLNAAFCGYGCGDGRGVHSVSNFSSAVNKCCASTVRRYTESYAISGTDSLTWRLGLNFIA
jgi:hypothetical protein